MTQTDLNKGINFFKAKANAFGTIPGNILMKADDFVDSLRKENSWSHKDSVLFVDLLLYNGLMDLKGMFLTLTAKGYSFVKDSGSGFLMIYLKELIFDPKESSERIFYKLWDLIGTNKDNNPFYVGGKEYFNSAKKFIAGLPPSYSKYTKDLFDKGESTSRIDWGLKLFQLIPKEEIPLFLDSLSDATNQSIKDKETHEDTTDNDLLENIMIVPEFNDVKIPDINMSIETKTPKIFISHNTQDYEYAKALVNLLTALGVNEENDVFCSSLPGCGVPFGKNFMDAIREQYNNHDLIMLFIHSPRYYNSHVSLCEMGAAWILNNEYRSFLTKDCEFDMLDAVVPKSETAFKAGQDNTNHLLNDFKSFIENKFNLKPKSYDRWETIKSDFISSITK